MCWPFSLKIIGYVWKAWQLFAKCKQVLKLLEFYVKLWSFMRTIFIEICYYKVVDFNSFVSISKACAYKNKVIDNWEVIKILFGPIVPFTNCFGLNLRSTIVLCKGLNSKCCILIYSHLAASCQFSCSWILLVAFALM